VPFFAANEKSANDLLLMNTMQTPELGEATFYNNLPQTLEKAWSLLEDAARNRHSPMHTPLVSSGEDHTVRTTRELRIHTDSRSAKVEELHRQPTCQVLTYYPVQKIQLCLDATATIHQETTLPAASGHKRHSPVAAVTSRK
jgi:hypothetical protein